MYILEPSPIWMAYQSHYRQCSSLYIVDIRWGQMNGISFKWYRPMQMNSLTTNSKHKNQGKEWA